MVLQFAPQQLLDAYIMPHKYTSCTGSGQFGVSLARRLSCTLAAGWLIFNHLLVRWQPFIGGRLLL